MPDVNTPSFRSRVSGALVRALGRLPGPVQVRLSRRPPVCIDGQTLDPTLQLLISARGRREPARLTRGTPEEARARFRRETLAVRGRSTPVGSVRDLGISGAQGTLPARHFAPPEATKQGDPLPLLVYFHGGGFMLGDLETHDEVCRLLCRHSGQHVLSVAYRLAPENPFPAAVEDAVAAFRWAQAHATELGADPSRVGVGGDSAGANLAAVVAQETARDRPPIAQLLIYPPIDHSAAGVAADLFGAGFFLDTEDRRAFSRSYCPQGSGTDPRIAPLQAPDLSGLPPALIITAGFDVLRDEGEAYGRAMEEAGSPAVVRREPSLGHGFVQLTGVCRAAHRATADLGRRWQALVAENSRP